MADDRRGHSAPAIRPTVRQILPWGTSTDGTSAASLIRHCIRHYGIETGDRSDRIDRGEKARGVTQPTIRLEITISPRLRPFACHPTLNQVVEFGCWARDRTGQGACCVAVLRQGGSIAQRNPTYNQRLPGVVLSRFAQRRYFGNVFHDPPR